MPTLTIDGREITVEPGTRIIQAADRLGIPIPRFCYHPGLTVAANCRMCLVESSKSAKLVPSCYDTCQDGAVVQTRSPRVLEARRAVLEYILLNHPVDCPICDQAGECDLQDLYFAHDHLPSRHGFRKAHKAKARPIGPRVMYDAERCINCTRCVRVCDEVAKAPQLRQVQRGERTYIDVFPGTELDHPYSLCTVDVCPVGALTGRDFRFKCRVWFMSGTQSVCGECSRGCAVRIDAYRGEVQRVVPRENPHVNGWWACDAGRLAYHRFQTGRVVQARARGTGMPYGAAARDLAEALVALPQGARAGAVLSAWMTCEEAWAVATLVRRVDPDAAFAIGGRAPGEADAVLVRADRNPNAAGVAAVLAGLGVAPAPVPEVLGRAAALDLLWVVDGGLAVAEAAVGALASAPRSVVSAALDSPVAAAATWLFPWTSPYEADGTWMNEDRVLQRVRPAVPAPAEARGAWRLAADVADRTGVPLGAATLAEAFAQVAGRVPGLAGLALDAVGPFGVKL